VTEKWRSEPEDSPRRDLFDLRCIAEIVSRFDVVAIEEAREDLSALRIVLDVLGDGPSSLACSGGRPRDRSRLDLYGRGDHLGSPLHSFAYAGFPPSAVQFTSAKSGLKCGVTFTTSPVSVLNTA
jgi:hypothetical protein